MPSINAPKTRFNQPVGPYRIFEAAEFPLDDIKMIKNAANAKVNDVVLTIVSGAMRKYLESLDELPEESLAAIIPLNMRTRRAVTEENNQVGSVFMDLNTSIKDPLERLRAIQHSATEAKEFGEQSPLVDALKLAGVFSPALTRPVVNLYIRNQLSRHMPANISTVISNVAGPPFPLYSAGARMVRYYGLGLLTPGMGLFHLAFSCDGVVTLSALADREIISDPANYRQCMYASFEELREAAQKFSDEQEAFKAQAEAKTASRKKAARGNGSRRAGAASKRTNGKTPASAKPARSTVRRSRAGNPRAPAKAPVVKARESDDKPAPRAVSLRPAQPAEPLPTRAANVVDIPAKRNGQG